MAWPTTQTPRTQFVTLRLTEDEAASLDEAARLRGVSRSTIIRDSVTRALKADARKAAKAAQ